MPSPSVAVVVPVHGRLPLTLRLLGAFRGVAYDNYRIVIVDDGSPDDTAEVLARDHPDVTVLPGDGDLWWTGATNLGVTHALAEGFDHVLTLNNDVVVDPAFLGRLVATAEANPRSIVGSRINYLDAPRTVWGAGGYTSWDGSHAFPLQLHDHTSDEADVLARHADPVAVELLTGCGTLVPTACYREVGLYDGRMFPHYHADSEFTLRARRRGYRILVDVRALVYNDEPQTCTVKSLLARRSPWYWRPLLAMHLRYCPRRQLLGSLPRAYARVLADQLLRTLERPVLHPLRRVKRFAQRLLRRDVKRVA